MRSVIKCVKRASVTVQGKTVGQISGGLLVLLAVGLEDGTDDLTWMVDKLVGLRIFEDAEMDVELFNDGPVTILLDSKKKFQEGNVND